MHSKNTVKSSCTLNTSLDPHSSAFMAVVLSAISTTDPVPLVAIFHRWRGAVDQELLPSVSFLKPLLKNVRHSWSLSLIMISTNFSLPKKGDVQNTADRMIK